MVGETAALVRELTGMERVGILQHRIGSRARRDSRRAHGNGPRQDRDRSPAPITASSTRCSCGRLTVNGEVRAAPIAPGIPDSATGQVMVLDYGNPESLELIRRHGHELAAVLVEPVQSRRLDLQPREFLHELRRITEADRHGAGLRRGGHRLPRASRWRAGVFRHSGGCGHLW